MELTKEQATQVARRYFANKGASTKVFCIQREFDYKWEMLQQVQDPTLDAQQLADLKARNIPHPLKWVTAAVVEPYIIEGIAKSLKREEEERNGKH